MRDLSVRVWRTCNMRRPAWRHIVARVRLLDEELSRGSCTEVLARRSGTFKRALVWCSVDTISASDDAVPHSSPSLALWQ